MRKTKQPAKRGSSLRLQGLQLKYPIEDNHQRLDAYGYLKAVPGNGWYLCADIMVVGPSKHCEVDAVHWWQQQFALFRYEPP